MTLLSMSSKNFLKFWTEFKVHVYMSLNKLKLALNWQNYVFHHQLKWSQELNRIRDILKGTFLCICLWLRNSCQPRDNIPQVLTLVFTTKWVALTHVELNKVRSESRSCGAGVRRCWLRHRSHSCSCIPPTWVGPWAAGRQGALYCTQAGNVFKGASAWSFLSFPDPKVCN